MAVDDAEARRRLRLRAIPRCRVLWARSHSRTTWRGRGLESSLLLVFQMREVGGRGDDVLFRRPVAEVDEAAAFAAKGHLGVIESYVFFADRALHTRICRSFSLDALCGVSTNSPVRS